MTDVPHQVRAGFVRIGVRLPQSRTVTPGQLATATGIDLDHVGLVHVEEHEAYIEVAHNFVRGARNGLEQIGPTRVLSCNWQWLKLAVGRNHGLTIGQLRKLMASVDAAPLGKLHVNNTHSLVGLQDFKLAGVESRLASARINGFAIRPEILPLGEGPGSAAFVPHHA